MFAGTQTDTPTHKHTDILITILRSFTLYEVKAGAKRYGRH